MTRFRLGDMVRVKEGAFQSLTGRIDGINQAGAMLKIEVNIHGRTWQAKVKFSEVEKIEFAEGRQSTER